MDNPLVAVIVGSESDTGMIQHCLEILKRHNISHEFRILSVHRTPDELFKYIETVETRGIEVIIAAAGGAAHLPGMIASKTKLPVLGIPIRKEELNGLDSLFSMTQMPSGVPVGTLGLGIGGSINAAYLAIRILAIKYKDIKIQ